MKKILYSLCFITTIFAIHVEIEEKIDTHKSMAEESMYTATGWLDSKDGYGTGTLIHPRVVLTTCLLLKEGADDFTFNIFLFDKFFSVKGRAVYHPDFLKIPKDKKSSINDASLDIALFILDEPLYGIAYPSLPIMPPTSPMNYSITGFGNWTNETPKFISQCKLAAKSHIKQFKYGILGAPFTNNEKIQLFGRASAGDLGAPLLSGKPPGVIHGIYKGYLEQPNDDDSDTEFYSLYISVHEHCEWIRKTIENELLKDS